MYLSNALQVQRGEVVSLVGAGGKTTAMYRLADEMAGAGWHVVTTTTTMIRPPSAGSTDALIVEGEPDRAIARVRVALGEHKRVTLAAQSLEVENKLRGIPGDWVAQLREMADLVIVEADGSRGLPIKAPAGHEPVIPDVTTLLVPVVGIDAVGRRLTETAVHRPALVAQVTGLALGDVIDAPAVARLLVHPQGALKGVPAGARVAPLLNKVESASALRTVREIAALAKRSEALDRIVIGAVKCDEPVREVWRHVSAVVLAAGGSSRLGRPKQLLPVAGTIMIEHVLDIVAASHVDEVVVVLGSSAEQVAQHVPAHYRKVINADWKTGISSSIRAGLDALDHRAQAAVFVLADQPRLTHEALNDILFAYYRSCKGIIVPTYRGRRGSPVLFERSLFPDLQALRGDVGGRNVMARLPEQVEEIEMPSDDLFRDVDTPTDYQNLES